MTAWDRKQEQEIYRYRRNLYGRKVNKWLDGYPKAPVASFMEWGGGIPGKAVTPVATVYSLQFQLNQNSPYFGLV